MSKTLEKRKAPTLEERLTPCEICGFPLTHRHHMLMFNSWGESNHVLAFCASCHELFHLAFNSIVHNNKRSTKVWAGVCEILGNDSDIVKKILEKVYDCVELNYELSEEYCE